MQYIVATEQEVTRFNQFIKTDVNEQQIYGQEAEYFSDTHETTETEEHNFEYEEKAAEQQMAAAKAAMFQEVPVEFQPPRDHPVPPPPPHHHPHHHREDEEHHHCKRFKHEGRAPPFPPVGGKDFMKDGTADTISITDTKCQQNTQNNFSIYQIEDKDKFFKQQQEDKCKFTFTDKKEDITTKPTTNITTQNTFIPQFTFDFKKRDQKFQEKANVQQAKVQEPTAITTKFICKGCHLKYNKLKYKDMFCHNCYKIYEAVEMFVRQNGGIFTFDDKKCCFDLVCQRQHHWIVDFKTKQVKKWCKICKKSDRAYRKEYFKQIEEEKQREFEKMQRDMFEEAKKAREQHNAETEEQGQTRNFLEYLIGEEGDERVITMQMMEDVVNFIINEPDKRLEHFFQQFTREKRTKIFRKLARMIHPDKNPHKLAKEAFQKLLSSSWRNCDLEDNGSNSGESDEDTMNFNFQFKEEDFVQCV